MLRCEDSLFSHLEAMKGSARGDLLDLRREEERVAGGVVEGLGGLKFTASGSVKGTDSQTTLKFKNLQNAVNRYLKAVNPFRNPANERRLKMAVPGRRLTVDGVIGKKTLVAVQSIITDQADELKITPDPPSSISDVASRVEHWTREVYDDLTLFRRGSGNDTSLLVGSADINTGGYRKCRPGYRMSPVGCVPADVNEPTPEADMVVSAMRGKAAGITIAGQPLWKIGLILAIGGLAIWGTKAYMKRAGQPAVEQF